MMETLEMVAEERTRLAVDIKIEGIQLQASDIQWTVGSGPLAVGGADDLILVLSGRPEGVVGLSGAGAPQLAQQLETVQ
jgi:hypothetical protein